MSVSGLFRRALADLPPRQLYPGHPDWDAYQKEVARRIDPILEGVVAAYGRAR